MDKALEIFVSIQTIALAMAVWMIVFAIRRVGETIWPWIKTNRYWTELFLPLGPIGTGMIVGLLAKKFPWPAAIGADPSASVRMIYAAICGMMSGFVYARVKAFFKAGTPANENENPPTPPGGA